MALDVAVVLEVKGFPVMHKGILPCLWRAPTDNDIGGGTNSYASKWKAASLHDMLFHAESCSIQKLTNHVAQIAVVFAGIPRGLENSYLKDKRSIICKVEMSYWIYESGDVIVKCNVYPRDDLPPLPRVGIEFHVSTALDRIKWFGKGPFECYPDRKEAAHIGVYEKSVADLHVPYIVPVECSGRADVRWVAFQNNDGFGLFGCIYGGSQPMQLNASYYSTAELDRATHHEELVKGDDIEVHLDHKHMGLGGDDSWSPCVHQQYLVPPVPYSFSLRFSPLSASTSCYDIYRSKLPE